MIFTSEQVSCGHPDKICDQISDAIVTDCLAHDKKSRVAAECMIKDFDIFIAGEITSKHQPDYETLAREVLKRIGIFGVEKFCIHTYISKQSEDIALGVDGKFGAGDQGMMFGYATNETPEMLPIPYAVATHALQLLREVGCPILLPDAKSQVSFDYENGRITTFLISTQHLDGTTVEDIRPIVEAVMETASQDYNLNTDFEKLVNPTGRFVVGSSFADSGLTGRKSSLIPTAVCVGMVAVRFPAKTLQRWTEAEPMLRGILQGMLFVSSLLTAVRFSLPMPLVWQNLFPCVWIALVRTTSR